MAGYRVLGKHDVRKVIMSREEQSDHFDIDNKFRPPLALAVPL
jgi:hypothetical protein